MELTTEQNAILKRSGSMVVIANAGTGKTTTLVEMVKKELPLLKEGQHIVCMTFTNMAADDIKSRIGETVSILATTIDSFLISFIGQLGYKPTKMADLSNMKEYAHNLRRAASMSEFYEAVKALADFLDIETDYNALTILYDTIENSDDRAYFLQDQYQYKAMTIHSAKGLEWDQVLIFAEDFPLDSVENRCLYYYVAVTRAKQKVVIMCRDAEEVNRLKYIKPYHLF